MRTVAPLSLLGMILVTGCAEVSTDSKVDRSETSGPLYHLMTESDVSHANGAIQTVLESSESGTELSWRNPVSNHSGSVTPIHTYRTKSGIYCRVYDETLSIGAKVERYTDTACRGPDGLWRPIEVD